MKDVIEIARRAHEGHRDKAGRDYFDGHLRPIAEAAAVFGPDAEAAGWLHDVIEDSELTAEHLLALGVFPDVVAAVVAVTKVGKEPYPLLIDRAIAHPLGRLVKLVDNSWNITCNPGLAATDPVKAASMMAEKYGPARVRLLAAAQLTESSPKVRAMQEILNRHLARLKQEVG